MKNKLNFQNYLQKSRFSWWNAMLFKQNKSFSFQQLFQSKLDIIHCMVFGCSFRKRNSQNINKLIRIDKFLAPSFFFNGILKLKILYPFYHFISAIFPNKIGIFFHLPSFFLVYNPFLSYVTMSWLLLASWKSLFWR